MAGDLLPPACMETAAWTVRIPANALVVLVGASGCGKSSFARARFAPAEIVSSDECRRLVSDDEASQAATAYAFPVFHAILRGRAALGRLAVADATNLTARARAPLLRIARAHGAPCIALAIDLPLEVCLARAAGRSRRVSPEVIRRHHAVFQNALREIPGEGIESVHRLGRPEAVTIERVEPVLLEARQAQPPGPE